MSNFSIAYQFKALTGNFQRNLKKMKSDMVAFNSQIKKQNISAKKLANSMTSIGKSMTMKVTAPILAAGTAVAFVGGKFEDSLASLEAITGLSGKALKKMQKQIMITGEDFGIASTDIAKGMELIGSKQPALLKTPELLLDVTKAAAILAKAAGQELPQASENLLSIMNAFSFSGERANEVINILAASSKYGAAQIPYLSEAMKHAAAGSKFAKLELNEVAAAIEIASEKTGLMSSMVGRGLGNSMLRLEAQINDNFKPSIVGLGKALDNIAAANLDAKSAMKLWGLENIKVANELLINRKQVIALSEKIKGTNVAYEQAAIRMKTFNEMMKRTWVMIKNRLIQVFFLIRPQLKEFALILGKIAKKAREFIKAHPGMIKFLLAVAGIAAVLGPALLILGVLIKALLVLKTIVLFFVAISSLITLPILAITAAIALLIVGIIYLWKNWKTIWDGIKAGAAAVISAWRPVKEFFKAMIASIVNGFMKMINIIKAFSPTNVWGGIKSGAFGAYGSIKEMLGFAPMPEIKSPTSRAEVSGNILIETRDPAKVIKNITPTPKSVNVGMSMAPTGYFD